MNPNVVKREDESFDEYFDRVYREEPELMRVFEDFLGMETPKAQPEEASA